MDKPRKAVPGKADAKPKPARKRRKTNAAESASGSPKEFGGPPGPEPTRYGDWQIKGRVSDF